MAEKKYTEMDYVMMKMQMLGNDTFTFGFANHYSTKEELYKDLISIFQKKLEELKNEPTEESKYGYKVDLEIVKKGEETKRF